MKHLKLFEEFKSNVGNLEVKTSNIPNSGDGLFTLTDIKKGELICEFTGVEISPKEAAKLEGIRGHYLIQRDNGTILDVFNSDSPAIKCNDARGSNFKNNASINEVENGEIWLIATRRIKAGEEIFCSYGDEYWENWNN